MSKVRAIEIRALIHALANMEWTGPKKDPEPIDYNEIIRKYKRRVIKSHRLYPSLKCMAATRKERKAERNADIMRMWADGKTSGEIAKVVGISPATVRYIVSKKPLV